MEAHVGVPNGNVRKSRTILRVVAESRWSKELVQRVIGTPHELTPVDDGELNSDDIEASEQPHEAEGEGTAGEGEPDVPEAHPVPRRVRITAKDLKKHGYTPGCPRCADLEYGKADSRKNHNDVCRARMYKKFEEEKNIKYVRVREEMRRAEQENRPPPDFVDLDSADYDRWLARETARERMFRPSDSSGYAPAPTDDPEPEAKRARPRVKTVDPSCNFDEDSGLYVPTDE